MERKTSFYYYTKTGKEIYCICIYNVKGGSGGGRLKGGLVGGGINSVSSSPV